MTLALRNRLPAPIRFVPALMQLYSCETGELTEWFDPNSLRNS